MMQKRVINFFKGDHWFLDNSFKTSILHMAVRYPTLTHAFLAAETDELELKLKISHSSLAELGPIADEIGTPYSGFQGPQTMRDLLDRKFGLKLYDNKMNSDQSWLSKRLMATGDHDLVYGNHACNQWWGNCECPKHFSEKGKNVLGGLLMGVRKRLIDDMVKYYDLDTTCNCQTVCSSFFLYSLDGKNWLKPFCEDCMPNASVVVSHCSDDGLIVRFEKAWVEKPRAEPINKIKVPRHHSHHQLMIPEAFRRAAWDPDDDRPWVGTRQLNVYAPPEPKFQSKVIHLSGRIK